MSNALAGGSELRCLNYRDTTPLRRRPGRRLALRRRRRHGDAGRRRRSPRSRRLWAVRQQAADRGADALGAGCSTTASRTSLPPSPHLALLCGRYEGIDERVREHIADDAISIGRYVLAGGELAAMVIADAVLRKLPGRPRSRRERRSRSRSRRLSEARRSTRTTPGRRAYRGWGVPEILLSGDHGAVRDWRLERSREREPESGLTFRYYSRPARAGRHARFVRPERQPAEDHPHEHHHPEHRERPAAPGPAVRSR